MAAGAAVVASDIPAFRALLADGANGSLFANEDPISLADAINFLSSNHDALARLSRAGIEAALQYDWSAVASRILSVYESAMAGHGKVGIGSESASWKRGR